MSVSLFSLMISVISTVLSPRTYSRGVLEEVGIACSLEEKLVGRNIVVR